MPPRQREPDLIRVVEGVAGDVDVEMELVVRFDYGAIVPWVRTIDGVLVAVGGPDALSLWSHVETHGIDLTTRASFRVQTGDRVPFLLMWHPSHEPAGQPIDTSEAVEDTCQWWEHWSNQSTYRGEWKEAVDRSLIVLKAMTFEPTGGVVAAPTTSLPEHIGGVRNWDYRYCWLRDASFTFYALLTAGSTTEAAAWQAWLLRAVAGDPGALQIMYGPASERRLTIEKELLRDGLVLRYQTGADTAYVDGLPPGEGAFLPCTFWLADNYALQERRPEARALFEHLLSLCNDVGLLAEEFDPAAKRLLGNFPQALSHVALVNTALILSRPEPKPKQSAEGRDR